MDGRRGMHMADGTWRIVADVPSCQFPVPSGTFLVPRGDVQGTQYTEHSGTLGGSPLPLIPFPFTLSSLLMPNASSPTPAPSDL